MKLANPSPGLGLEPQLLKEKSGHSPQLPILVLQNADLILQKIEVGRGGRNILVARIHVSELSEQLLPLTAPGCVGFVGEVSQHIEPLLPPCHMSTHDLLFLQDHVIQETFKVVGQGEMCHQIFLLHVEVHFVASNLHADVLNLLVEILPPAISCCDLLVNILDDSSKPFVDGLQLVLDIPDHRVHHLGRVVDKASEAFTDTGILANALCFLPLKSADPVLGVTKPRVMFPDLDGALLDALEGSEQIKVGLLLEEFHYVFETFITPQDGLYVLERSLQSVLESLEHRIDFGEVVPSNKVRRRRATPLRSRQDVTESALLLGARGGGGTRILERGVLVTLRGRKTRERASFGKRGGEGEADEESSDQREISGGLGLLEGGRVGGGGKVGREGAGGGGLVGGAMEKVGEKGSGLFNCSSILGGDGGHICNGVKLPLCQEARKIKKMRERRERVKLTNTESWVVGWVEDESMEEVK
ncbi:hypothetical protein N7461_001580 [Penicillium sp. DV-2018c]|nr:hypothetical protein N7461_001580 [Penicillium sp. DV-2018c]